MNAGYFMFDNNFEIYLADTRESREIHYSIRYQVYCEEMEFEKKHCFPKRLEFDEYDQHAVHFIARHKSSGRWVGAVRLILKIDGSLPIEKYCQLNDDGNDDVLENSAELSRLCVVKEIRKGILDMDPPNGIADEMDMYKETRKVRSIHSQPKISRSVMWGLLNAVTEYCYSNNINNWYFMTTDGLATMLRRGGFEMSNIGEAINHKGKRYPFKKDVVAAFRNETWRSEYKQGFYKYSELQRSEFMGIAV